MAKKNVLLVVLLVTTIAAFSQPTISGFTPLSGIVGQSVTITGTNFSTTAANNIVKFNGVVATISGTPTATSIVTTVPTGATTGKITVTVGTATATSTNNFTVPPPTITSFAPVRGIVGSSVTITGTNFSPTSANNLVKFNGITATVTSASATSLTVTVPTAATTGPITVSVGGQTATSASNFFVCPSISVSVTTTNKTSFTFAASGGTAPYTYSMDGGATFQPATNYSLSVGTYSVIAKDANGCTGTSDFKINGIVDCSVTQSSGGQGTTFTTHILGSGSGEVRVTYEMYTITDQMDIFYDNVLVASTNGLVSGSNTLKFNYTYDPAKPNFCVIRMYAPNSGTAWDYAAYCPEIPAPQITSFYPPYGNVGTNVTITGKNFVAGSTVKFGTVSATVGSINSQGTSMTATVPAGAVTAPITVTNSLGTRSSVANFVVSGYCASYATSQNYDRIDKVTFAGINNVSPTGICESYTDNTSLVGFVTAGQTYDLKVTLGTCSGNYSKSVRAFIDWNGDLDFADANEIVAATTTVSSTTHEETFPVTVPAGTPAISNTRMRIVLVETSTPTNIVACGTYTWGETEDYAITVLSGATPAKSVSPTTLPEFLSATNFPSDIKSFGVSGANLGVNAFTITAPAQFQVSLQPSAGFGSSVSLSPVNGSISAPIFVRYFPNASGNHTGTISITSASFGTPSTVQVSGKATTISPSLSVFALLTDFTSSGIGFASSTQSFRLTASYLTGNLIITAPANFELSTTTVFTPSLTLTPVNGELKDQIIKVRFNPATGGTTSGNIILSSAGMVSQGIPVTGIAPGSGTVPTISGFTPTSGAIGSPVTITGTNFSTTTANNIVKFNNTTATVTASTATSITTTVPSGATTGPISVTVGTATATSVASFQVTTASSPTITSFSPGSGPVGTAVTITGTNFSTTAANNIVKFNGVTATVNGTPTSTSLSVAVPTGATTGLITVTVGGQTASSSTSFQVTSTAPTIAFFNPISGQIGSSVIITGSNFSTTPANNVVKFNNTVATVTASSSTSITATVPVGATTGNITVTVGGQSAISTGVFTVTSATSPTITSLNPTIGSPGSQVIIKGTNFSTTPANNIVRFNNVQSTVTSSTATSIATTVPANATTGNVTVTVGSETATSADVFTVTTAGGLAILGLNPTGGPVGTKVQITGTNFDPIPENNVVKFNGVAVIPTESTGTIITATVPAGATTGKITVGIGSEVATSPLNFVVFPTVTEFTPVSGLPGSSVVITGLNFASTNADNQVFFNEKLATITSSSTTSITATVPADATTGKIRVANVGFSGISADDFTVLGTEQTPPCTKPAKPTIITSGLNTESPVLTSSAATGNQWFFNGAAISGATNKTFTVTAKGIYKVQVTDAGCISDFSDDIAIIVTGDVHSQNLLHGIRYYPNPAEDKITFEVPGDDQKRIQVYRADGGQVLDIEFISNAIEIPLNAYMPGIYAFSITSGNARFTAKFLRK